MTNRSLVAGSDLPAGANPAVAICATVKRDSRRSNGRTIRAEALAAVKRLGFELVVLLKDMLGAPLSKTSSLAAMATSAGKPSEPGVSLKCSPP